MLGPSRVVAAVARPPSTSWRCSATTPASDYEDLQAQAQAQLGIGRAEIGGVLTSLAASRKRLPRDVDYPIQRDA